MLSTADALATLLGAAVPVDGVETLATLDALNRVLATDVMSSLDVPPMNTSSMDGYAMRAADLAPHGDRRLPVSQRIPAGHAPRAAEARHGGAHLHRRHGAAGRGRDRDAGANRGRRQRSHDPAHADRPANGSRQQGADIRNGAVILPAGTRLTPQALGLAASVGCAATAGARAA